jgi:hypothetical protein
MKTNTLNGAAMTDIEFIITTHRQPIKFDLSMLEETLSHSTGEPTMSNEDMKLSILNLIGIVKHQQVEIEKLARVVNEDIKKRSRRNIFKK